MTPQRDIGTIIERWLVDGVDQMPDRVYLTILDRVDREPQRPSWRLQPWRFPTMPTPIKLALTGVALLVVVLGGAVFLGSGAGPGPTPSPTPAPTPTATLSPTPSASSSPTPQRVGMDLQGDAASYTIVAPAGWTGTGGWTMTKSQ